MEPLNYLNFGNVYNPDHEEVVGEKRKEHPNQEGRNPKIEQLQKGSYSIF